MVRSYVNICITQLVEEIAGFLNTCTSGLLFHVSGMEVKQDRKPEFPRRFGEKLQLLVLCWLSTNADISGVTRSSDQTGIIFTFSSNHM